MTNMPSRSDLVSGTTTEADFQSALGDLYDVINQLGIIGAPELNVLSSDNVTPTKCNITLDTESNAATDTLKLIIPTNLGEKMAFIRINSNARVITVKHLASGTGKIFLNGEADVVLEKTSQCISLAWDDTLSMWREVNRNFGFIVPPSGETSLRTSLGLGTAATKNTGISTGQIPLIDNLGSAAFVNTGVSSGQVPLANQLGSLAFKSSVSDSELTGTGVSPGTYSSVTVNAQGRVTAASGVGAPQAKFVARFDNAGTLAYSYNVSSVAPLGGGLYQVNFSSSIGTNYAAFAMGSVSDGTIMGSTVSSISASSCIVRAGGSIISVMGI